MRADRLSEASLAIVTCVERAIVRQRRRDDEQVGGLRRSPFATCRRDNLEPRERLQVVEGTVADGTLIDELVGRQKPDVIVHAAAAYKDPDGYRRSATHASLLGFDGKWAIHPSQVPIANDVFSPTPDEIAAARRSVEEYRAAEAQGVGAIGSDGRLVDAAHMRLAENILHKANLD